MQKIAIFFIAAVIVEISLVTQCQPPPVDQGARQFEDLNGRPDPTERVSYPKIDLSSTIDLLKVNQDTPFYPPQEAQNYSYEQANQVRPLYPHEDPQYYSYIKANQVKPVYPHEDLNCRPDPTERVSYPKIDLSSLTSLQQVNQDTPFYPPQDAQNYSYEQADQVTPSYSHLVPPGELQPPAPQCDSCQYGTQIICPPPAYQIPTFPPEGIRCSVLRPSQHFGPKLRRATKKVFGSLKGQHPECAPFIKYCGTLNKWVKRDCHSDEWVVIQLQKCNYHTPDQLILWDEDTDTFHVACCK